MIRVIISNRYSLGESDTLGNSLAEWILERIWTGESDEPGVKPGLFD